MILFTYLSEILLLLFLTISFNIVTIFHVKVAAELREYYVMIVTNFAKFLLMQLLIQVFLVLNYFLLHE